MSLAALPTRSLISAKTSMPPSLWSTAHAIASLAHRAFKEVAHPQFAPDLLHINGLSLVGEARVASEDEQPADARQRGDDLLDHAVDEIFLLGIAGNVLERQDRDRRLVWNRQAPLGSGVGGGRRFPRE